jgi:hypothetical protein
MTKRIVKTWKCVKRKHFNNFVDFMYIDNSDKSKYRSLTTGLQTQQSLGNNQYPKTITDANNVLSSHCFDNVGKKSSEKPD